MKFLKAAWLIICQVFGFQGVEVLKLSEYTGWHFLALLVIGTLLVVAFIFVVFCVFWILWKLLKGIGTLTTNIFSAKKRCQKIQCPTCGRTLDKCTCQKNKNRGYIRRLALYSKEKKEKQKAVKNK